MSDIKPVKQAPVQGMTGLGGGPTSLSNYQKPIRRNFETYKMFAPKGSIATSNMTGAGRSGIVVYPCKASITENSDFDDETGTSLTASTFFDSPTPTIAGAFGIASNVSTTVNIIVRDDSYNHSWDPENYNAYSSHRDDVISDWDDFPKPYDPPNGEPGGIGVAITGFWKTDTDSLGKWKTSASGVYAQPSRTVASSGTEIDPNNYSMGFSDASDAVTEPDNATSGMLFTAGYNPYNFSGGLDSSAIYFAQFVFNSGLGSAKGFVIQGWNDYTWLTNGKGAHYQGHVFIIDVFAT